MWQAMKHTDMLRNQYSQMLSCGAITESQYKCAVSTLDTIAVLPECNPKAMADNGQPDQWWVKA